ncbi:MAG: gamma-glutamyl-gamma-aminobutyrate hydrolase family protein [Myxococcota bacterium]
MPKLLVLQHVAHEILGTLDPLLRSYGFRNRYVNFDREPEAQPALDGYHGLVVLGGPMNVDQTDRHPHLATEIEVIHQALERELPVLGICLGAQLLAKTLGARVYPGPEKEIGWYDLEVNDRGRSDPLFARFGAREKVFQWHGDTFDIPEGAELLATSRAGTHQAFRFGDRVYGMQCHLEVDAPMIERWLQVPVNQAELAELQDSIDPEQIRRETPRRISRLRELSRDCFGGFVRLFGELRQRSAQPHR